MDGWADRGIGADSTTPTLSALVSRSPRIASDMAGVSSDEAGASERAIDASGTGSATDRVALRPAAVEASGQHAAIQTGRHDPADGRNLDGARSRDVKYRQPQLVAVNPRYQWQLSKRQVVSISLVA